MLKRILAIATLVCAVPALASAWTLNTWVKSSGGTIKIGAGTPQTSVQGNVFKSYTTHQSVPVAVNAGTGYTIKNVTVNGSTVASSGTTYSGSVSGPTAQSVFATFVAQNLAITATAGAGGSVTPISVTNVFYGQKLLAPIKFYFTPAAGYKVADITGVPGSATISSALPAAAGVQVVVTIPTGTVMTAGFTLGGTFSTTASIPKVEGTKTILLPTGSVQLSAAASVNPQFYNWSTAKNSQLSSRTVVNPVFTPAAAGTYNIFLKVGGTSSATQVVYATTSVADAAKTQCVNCHNQNGIGQTPNVFNAWSSSAHKTNTVMCASCHVGANSAAHPGATPTNSICAGCHTSIVNHSAAATTCNQCHDAHPATKTHATAATRPDCATCHEAVASAFAVSQHGTRQGKATWYNDNLNNPNATELQKGFGNYVNVAYTSLPCGKCHNAAAWTVNGVDTWAATTGGVMVCNDCHGNKAAGVDTTAVNAPVTKATCFGCHSRQANEASAGLTDVHFVAGMGCPSCHTTADMHGTGSQAASQLVWGTISAQCENCHGDAKSQGPIRMDIPEHSQHIDKIACSTCHAESMITCHNCHFDNEAGAGGALKAKFFSGKFGGTHASGNSWRYLVNRVMPDGSTKVYPGSMQSLVADYTVDNADNAQGHTHAGIAPYYSHTITRVNALTCDKCHGIESAVKLAAGQPVRVTTWNAAAGVAVPAANVTATFIGPKGVIPVPENPRGKLLMDFVDLTTPSLGTASPRVLFQKDGPDTIHMPEAFVKPLTSAQMNALAMPYRVGATTAADAHSTSFIGTNQLTEHTSCGTCHKGVFTMFSTSQHGTRQGKATWYNDNMNNPGADELQKGFGNYVNVTYASLPCGKCHAAAAWTVAGTDQWTASTGGKSVCTDCHGNKAAGNDTTSVYAPVAKTTCFGCHSRQANETAAGLTDVHFVAGMGCTACHSTTDMHGTGSQTASQLQGGTISAQCENCHGEGKSRGPIRMDIAEHSQHMGTIACSTCHAESMITCHNCHFDNEAGAGGALKAKFFSGRFGGTHASGNSWRYLVNRVMPDGSTKVYPGSMQSLVADYTVDNADNGVGHTHAGIAPYYSHTITRVNALRCDKCHGIEAAVKLAAGQPVRVTTWNAAAGVAVPAASVTATFTGPKGVIPVPENPRGKLLMDFVDLTTPSLGTNSPRVLFQKDGPDTIHMPEAYVKPLTAAQMRALAMPYREGATTADVAHNSTNVPGDKFTSYSSCGTCHTGANTVFSTSLHYTRQGKVTFYNDNQGNAGADPLQKGFGSYVNVAYTDLPCAKCHNAADNGPWDTNPTVGVVNDAWPGTPVCTDCHGNNGTTSYYAPVNGTTTCWGCHSRQKTEYDLGLRDVHFNTNLADGSPSPNLSCSGCHEYTDLHGTGTVLPTQLADGAIKVTCEKCHTTDTNFTAIPEHSQHLANIACSTCHMTSVITCYGCHFDNEAGAPGVLKAKFASGKFGGTGASAWRFLVNRVMPDGSSKVYPASMQSLVADYTAANAPGEDNQGWTHAAIAPYYSHSITKVNALKCDKCHGVQNAIDLNNGLPVRVVKWGANAATSVPVSSMMSTYTTKPTGIIPVPENPVGKLLMDFVDLTNPAASPLNASGTSPSPRLLFKADGPDTIHMPEAYVKPMTAAQIQKLATPQARPQ